jgi:hypothetical protein
VAWSDSHAKASGDAAVRSIAGSTVENDSTLSVNFAPDPSKAPNRSEPSGGQAFMPVSDPL